MVGGGGGGSVHEDKYAKQLADQLWVDYDHIRWSDLTSDYVLNMVLNYVSEWGPNVA